MMKINIQNLKYYLISADKDIYIKRRKKVLPLLREKNIIPEIILGENSKIGGWYGFFLAINKELSRDKFEPFVILEDDVNFFEFRSEIEVPDSADAVWLGNSMSMIRYKRINNDISQIFGKGSTHAILFLTRNFCLSFRWGLELSRKFNIYYDVPTKMCQEMHEVYTLNTPIFFQDSQFGGQERETKFILAGSRITDEEYERWKKYRRIGIDPIQCFVGFPEITYKLE